MHFRKAFTWGLLLIAALHGGAATVLNAAPRRIEKVAVFPLANLRGTEKGRLISFALQDAVRRSLLRSGKFAVLENDAARQWSLKLAFAASAAPSASQLETLQVEAVVHGSIHLVLELAVLKLRVTGAGGSLLPDGVYTLRAELESIRPEELAARMIKVVGRALGAEPAPSPLPEPEQWGPLLDLQARLDPREKGGGDPRAVLDGRMSALEKLSAEPALAGRVAAARAALHLERAQNFSDSPASRRAELEAALREAGHATAIEPWNAAAVALKAEAFFFLRRYYEAKTEASVARLKNPLSAVARVVRALVEGLSTGAAAENMQAALLANPFLRADKRAPGSAPFQGGLLEPFFAKWDRLRGKTGRPNIAREDPNLKKGIELFEDRRWREAARALRRAADSDSYDYRPLLFLARIVIETGEPLDAAEHLKKLTTEFPDQADIHFYLGIALEMGMAYPQAIDAFEKVRNFRPADEKAFFHIGTAALALEDWEKASDVFREVLEKDENNSEAWLRLGIASARLKDWEAAEEALQKTLEMEPGSPDATQWLDWLNAQRAKQDSR